MSNFGEEDSLVIEDFEKFDAVVNKKNIARAPSTEIRMDHQNIANPNEDFGENVKDKDNVDEEWKKILEEAKGEAVPNQQPIPTEEKKTPDNKNRLEYYRKLVK
jgi:hypothetical protein